MTAATNGISSLGTKMAVQVISTEGCIATNLDTYDNCIWAESLLPVLTSISIH